MKTLFLLMPLAVVFLLILNSCNDKESISNPPDESEKLYKVAFEIKGYEGFLQDVIFSFDSIDIKTDSTGLVKFDSISTGSHFLNLSHKDYRTIDTSIVIKCDTTIRITMNLKNDSFFPMTLGSRWIYRDNWEKVNLTIEAVQLQEIEGHTYTKFSKIETKDDGFVKGKRETFYRISNDTLYRYVWGTYTGATIYALFNKPEGTEFEYVEGDEVWQSNITGKIVFKESSYIRIYYDSPAWDDEHTLQFKKGVGMESTCGGMTYCFILVDYDIKY